MFSGNGLFALSGISLKGFLIQSVTLAPKIFSPMFRVLLLLILVLLTARQVYAQTGESDMAKAFRKGLEDAEQNRIRYLSPRATINGSLYTDSAYGFNFRFDPGDSIVNRSANGQMVVIIENRLFYVRINSVDAGSGLVDYAKAQREQSKDKEPDGASHYKVSKLSQEGYTYKYNVRYVAKDGLATVSSVRMKYAQHKYGYLKIVGLFPDDAEAPAKDERLDRLMRVLETFSTP